MDHARTQEILGAKCLFRGTQSDLPPDGKAGPNLGMIRLE
jgi:hypothetical protein